MTRMPDSPMVTTRKHPQRSEDPQPRCPALELRWTAVMAANDERLAGHGDHHRPRELILCMRITPTCDDRASLHACVQADDAHTLLADIADATIDTIEDRSLLHLTMRDPAGRELLAVTLRRSCESPDQAGVLYARTPMLAEAGFTGGRSDPPTLAINSR